MTTTAPRSAAPAPPSTLPVPPTRSTPADPEPTDAWLPAGFEHPTRVAVTRHHHLRPIQAEDVDLDLLAVLGSRARLFSIYGAAWSWPPVTLTREQDEADLAHHEQEIATHRSFNYALLNQHETALLGCVYLDPATRAGFDVEVSWWVVDSEVGSELNSALDALVPTWLQVRWPFSSPVFPGRDLTWTDYLTLPAHPHPFTTQET